MKIIKNLQLSYNKMKKTNGFTLLEILISIFLLAVGLLGVITLVYTIIKTNDLSKNITKSTKLAENTIESEITHIFLEENFPETDISYTRDYNEIYQYEEFKEVVKIKSNNPTKNMCSLNVIIYWDNDQKKTEFNMIIKDTRSEKDD